MASLATTDDLAGYWRALTSDEDERAERLLAVASIIIRQQFPTIDDLITSGDLDAESAAYVASMMVKRVLLSPGDGVKSDNEQVGPFAHSVTYENSAGNLYLTSVESALLTTSAAGVSAKSVWLS